MDTELDKIILREMKKAGGPVRAVELQEIVGLPLPVIVQTLHSRAVGRQMDVRRIVEGKRPDQIYYEYVGA